jgi:hypothetical protein
MENNTTRQDLDEAAIKVTLEKTDVDTEEVDVHIIGIENDPQSGIAAAYDYDDGSDIAFIEIVDEGDVAGVDADVDLNQ